MAASCAAVLLFVPVAGDAAASPGALASLRRPRSARSRLMEEDMREIGVIELEFIAQQRANRFAPPHRSGTAKLAQGFDRASQRTHHATQYRMGAGAPQLGAVALGGLRPRGPVTDGRIQASRGRAADDEADLRRGTTIYAPQVSYVLPRMISMSASGSVNTACSAPCRRRRAI